MKKSYVVIWALALFVVTIPLVAGAVINPPSPHYGSGIQCITCHASTPQGPGKQSNSPGFVATSPVIYNNVCQNCHRPGDALAAAKPLAAIDASLVLGGQGTAGTTKMQTSHRWDGSDTNPAAGALPPVMGAMTTAVYTDTYNLRGRTGNQLACVRCHSVHINPDVNGNSLRMANDQDQMCMDCHRSRAQQSHLSGTHPVNVNYNSAKVAAPGSFNATPQNANPANPTSDLSAKLTSTGNIVCSTCHGVHYTDSRSSTFDGASSAKGRYNYANLSTGDGYILRTDRKAAAVAGGQTDNLNICTNCHTGKMNHNAKGQNIQCTDCHGAHVDYDPTNSAAFNPQNLKNVYLIQRNPTTPGASKIYFRYTGSQREYKNANGTGVCQGCHAVPGTVPEHSSNNANDCNGCHTHGSQAGAFTPSCNGCHGNPPTTTAVGGPDGMADPATGALGGTAAGGGAAGAHAKHATLHNMNCNTCHNTYLDKTMKNNRIDLGFAVNPANVPGFKGTSVTGTYNNTGALLNSYTFTGPIGTGPNRTCSTVYCHGGTLTPGYLLNPAWTGPSGTVSCGTCHAVGGDELVMGSHITHAGSNRNMACSQCHPDVPDGTTAHMQGSVQWDLSGIGGQYKPAGGTSATTGETNKIAPSAAYGSCSNVSCHSTVQGAGGSGAPSYAVVTWGGSALNCGSCHADMSTGAGTGSHARHTVNAVIACDTCHSGLGHNTSSHANGLIELALSGGSYSKTTSFAPGLGYGSCSNISCHGQATNIQWGSSMYSTTDTCAKCHASQTSVTTADFYSTEYPTKQTANTNAKVGAHSAHLRSTDSLSAALSCNDCHGAVTDVNSAGHMNGKTDFTWGTVATTGNVIPTYSNGTCFNTYCHGNAMLNGDTAGTKRNPTWNDTTYLPATLTTDSCKTCHGFPPNIDGHPTYANPTFVDCAGCHDNVNSAGTTYANIFKNKALHVNGIYEPSVIINGCNGCHGYPPANKRFVPAAGNWEFAKMENYTGGGGAHTVAGHVKPTANASTDGWTNCTPCHNSGDHKMTPIAFNPSSNIKVRVDSRLRFNKATLGKYSSNKKDGALHVSGKCSSVACHFQKTPKW